MRPVVGVSGVSAIDNGAARSELGEDFIQRREFQAFLSGLLPVRHVRDKGMVHDAVAPGYERHRLPQLRVIAHFGDFASDVALGFLHDLFL